MKLHLFFILLLINSINCWADVLAGIEIGSKGIKAIAIDYAAKEDSKQPGEQGYKIIFREDIKADIIEGAKNGLLDTDKIAEGAKAIEVLFRKLKKYDPQSFSIVGSTSFDNYTNTKVLEDAVFEKIGLRIGFITLDEEIFYALKASVRAKYAEKSILIDVGSGNTKIGYATPMSAKGFESMRFEYGTKSLSAKASSMGGDYLENLKQIANSEIIPAIDAAIQKQPGLESIHRRIYIEGGASWAVASFAQPQNIKNSFTYLTMKEIDNVTGRFYKNDLSSNANTEVGENTFIKISDNFDTKQLQAGATILKTILSRIKAEQRRIIFNRNGGWIIGYILAKHNEKNKVE